MRTATIYNFLLEANLMASIAILLMIGFRKFLRKPLGNRLIYFLWLLIAVRLLVPLALSNPFINEFRPYYLEDLAIRPIAGQIKVRFEDAFDDLRRLMRSDRDSLLYQGAAGIVDGMYSGTFSKQIMRLYLCGAGAVALFFGVANVRFLRGLKANRIEQISGKLREQYLDVCKKRNIKPIPVWFADPLPSACLVGVVRPYIALPLTAAPQEAVYVLTHELCHYKGRDHWFGMLRLLCCVIHWFNPLVWAAAFMSRTDGELACDSRVVRSLSPDDRLNYSNTLVLSASRRYAPGVGGTGNRHDHDGQEAAKPRPRHPEPRARREVADGRVCRAGRHGAGADVLHGGSQCRQRQQIYRCNSGILFRFRAGWQADIADDALKHAGGRCAGVCDASDTRYV